MSDYNDIFKRIKRKYPKWSEEKQATVAKVLFYKQPVLPVNTIEQDLLEEAEYNRQMSERKIKMNPNYSIEENDDPRTWIGSPNKRKYEEIYD